MSITATWVIVSYGGIADAVQLIGSIGASPTWEFAICANKAGDAAAAAEALGADPRVRIYDFPDNPGYLPALHRIRQQLDLSRPVILSNCDLISEEGIEEVLRATIDRFPDAGLLAPAIIGTLGQDQNPNLMRPPSARWLSALAILHRHPPLADLLLLRRGGHSARTISGVPSGAEIFAAHGSCVILMPQFFAAGGRTDYPFPLFGEELWLGSECARLGLRVHYVPEVRLHHAEHAATGARRRRGAVARIKYEGLRWWVEEARARDW